MRAPKTQPVPVIKDGFAVIRLNPEGQEIMFHDEMDVLHDLAESKAVANNRKLPEWARIHPIVRIVRTRTTETP